jgi:hypothetical protein
VFLGMFSFLSPTLIRLLFLKPCHQCSYFLACLEGGLNTRFDPETICVPLNKSLYIGPTLFHIEPI